MQTRIFCMNGIYLDSNSFHSHIKDLRRKTLVNRGKPPKLSTLSVNSIQTQMQFHDEKNKLKKASFYTFSILNAAHRDFSYIRFRGTRQITWFQHYIHAIPFLVSKCNGWSIWKEKKKEEGEEDSGGGRRWNLMKLSCESLPPEKVKERDEESRPIQKQWKETKRSWGGNILKGVDQKVVSLLLETECWHHRSVLSICHISLVGDFYRLLLKSGNSGMKWEQKNFPRSFLKCGHAYQSGQDLRLENTLHCSSLPLCSSLSDSFFIWIPSPLFCSRTFTILSSFQKCLSLSLSFAPRALLSPV